MPAYPFRKEMVFPILLGTKPHTIRRRRVKNPTKPGDQIKMFVNWRTKNVVQFAVAPCVKVEPIIMYPWTYELLVADHQGVYRWMLWEDIDVLARRDGFESDVEFFHFFRQYKEKKLDDFEIIWWDPQRVIVPPGVRFFRAGDLSPNPFPKMEGEKVLAIYDDPLKDMPVEQAKDVIEKMRAVMDWEKRRKR